jgi:hypothetical protein
MSLFEGFFFDVFLCFLESDWISILGISQDQIPTSIIPKLGEISESLTELYNDGIPDNSFKLCGIISERHDVKIPQVTKFIDLVNKGLKSLCLS